MWNRVPNIAGQPNLPNPGPHGHQPDAGELARVEIPAGEKAATFASSAITAAGIGTGVGVSGYWFATAATGSAGLGLSAGALAPWVLGAAGALSLAIAIPAGIFLYRDHMKTARELEAKKKHQTNKQAELKKQLELEYLWTYRNQVKKITVNGQNNIEFTGDVPKFVQSIYRKLLYKEKDFDAILEFLRKRSLIELRELEEVKRKLEILQNNLEIMTARVLADTEELLLRSKSKQEFQDDLKQLESKIERNKLLEQKHSLEARLEELKQERQTDCLKYMGSCFDQAKEDNLDVYNEFFRTEPLLSQKAKLGPVVGHAALGFLGGFGIVLGTSWSIGALVLGTFSLAAVATVATGGLLGIAFLGAAVLGGLAVAATMAYAKYKNQQREAKVIDLKAGVNLLKSARTEQVDKVVSKQQLKEKNALEQQMREQENLHAQTLEIKLQEKDVRFEEQVEKSEKEKNDLIFKYESALTNMEAKYENQISAQQKQIQEQAAKLHRLENLEKFYNTSRNEKRLGKLIKEQGLFAEPNNKNGKASDNKPDPTKKPGHKRSNSI